MNRKPCVPESVCFGKVAMAGVVANHPTTHLSCFTFLKAVSIWRKKFFRWELYTCLFVSKVKCFFIYDILFLNLRHISFVSGRLPKVDQFMVCQNSGKFELSNFKKSHYAHIAKHMILFGEALVVISTLNQKNKNVLVVTCTFNLKIKIFSLWAL